MRDSLVVIFLVLFVSGPLPAHGRGRDRSGNRQQVERTVAASPQVVVSACVISGNVTARGWDRNEVHARVSDGVQIDLTRIDQTKSQPATELKLTAGSSRGSSCLPFGDIELDLPRNASLKLQTNNGDIQVTEVARVTASSQAGSTKLTKVRDEANVNTIGGEISVRDSTGSFKLHTVGGSVDARDLGGAAAGDTFEASTIGGDIRLERIRHQRLRVNTVSGEVDYAGPLSRGGRYNFQSISGRLHLTLPADSSFRLSGTLGAGGDLRSDFNLSSPEKDTLGGAAPSGPMRRLDGTVGSGDASITVSFFSGSIQIRKQ
ncbi:MAG TPA: DUF4097 family beta strand repeat-containing protein [Blastocatellia bacterium]|nr:DUF4097 family beta strand repeat-containing protein [Blastocatellia bacterium]